MKKKSLVCVAFLMVFGFVFALFLCFGALNGAVAVSALHDGGMKIVVDAGHGGVDGGVVGVKTGVKESDVNLEIAYKLCDELTDLGFEVVMTRKTKAGLYGTATGAFKRRDMLKRKEIIQQTNPSMVISIHQNRYPSQSVRGAQVFYDKNSEGGRALALAVQDRVNTLYESQNVKRRNATQGAYFMLQCTSSPSIIVECGFLSSPKDEVLLCKEGWQRSVAKAVVYGVVDYLEGRLA